MTVRSRGVRLKHRELKRMVKVNLGQPLSDLLERTRVKLRLQPSTDSKRRKNLSNRTVEEYYDLLCREALAAREAHGGDPDWWKEKPAE